MYLIANEDISHYKVTVTIAFPVLRDKRGVSTSKSEAIAGSIGSVTLHAVGQVVYGPCAQVAKALHGSHSWQRHGDSYVVTVQFDLPSSPLTYDLALALEVQWNKVYNRDFEAFLECKRHYTAEEILEHCW